MNIIRWSMILGLLIQFCPAQSKPSWPMSLNMTPEQTPGPNKVYLPLVMKNYFRIATQIFLPGLSTHVANVLEIRSVEAPNCPAYVDVPVLFTQPDTTAATSLAFNLTFDGQHFQEQFESPDSPSNKPQVSAGSTFSELIPDSYLSPLSLQLSAGSWRILLIPNPLNPLAQLPSGQLLMLRFFLVPGTPNGTYPLVIDPNSTTVPNLTLRNGSIRLSDCLPASAADPPGSTP